MTKKAVWFVLSCPVVTALLLASCASTVSEEEEVERGIGDYCVGQSKTTLADTPSA